MAGTTSVYKGGGMMMELAAKTHRSEFDRRQKECSLPPGMTDRRIRAERRFIAASPIPFNEWAEAASNFYYHPPLAARSYPRRKTDRRISECGPPVGSAERRVTAERRHPDVANIPLEEWDDAMSNYYYLFHRI